MISARLIAQVSDPPESHQVNHRELVDNVMPRARRLCITRPFMEGVPTCSPPGEVQRIACAERQVVAEGRRCTVFAIDLVSRKKTATGDGIVGDEYLGDVDVLERPETRSIPRRLCGTRRRRRPLLSLVNYANSRASELCRRCRACIEHRTLGEALVVRERNRTSECDRSAE